MSWKRSVCTSSALQCVAVCCSHCCERFHDISLLCMSWLVWTHLRDVTMSMKRSGCILSRCFACHDLFWQICVIGNVCCSMLQCVWQCFDTCVLVVTQTSERDNVSEKQRMHKHIEDLQAALERMKKEQRAVMEQVSSATHCNALQRAATHCNALQCTATHYTTLQCTATHCNVCNISQRTATRWSGWKKSTMEQVSFATHCSTLQHTATHCNTLQHTATMQERVEREQHAIIVQVSSKRNPGKETCKSDLCMKKEQRTVQKKSSQKRPWKKTYSLKRGLQRGLLRRPMYSKRAARRHGAVLFCLAFSKKKSVYSEKSPVYFEKRALNILKRAMPILKRSVSFSMYRWTSRRRWPYSTRSSWTNKKTLYILQRALHILKRVVYILERALPILKRSVSFEYADEPADAAGHEARGRAQ